MATLKKTRYFCLITLFHHLSLFSTPIASVSPQEKKRVKAEDILELSKHIGPTSEVATGDSMLKSQILYVISKGEQVKALQMYQQYYKQTLEHDYKLLREIGLSIIEDGISKGSELDCLLALIAIEIAQEDCFTHHLGKLIKSKFFPVQAKTLSLLKGIDNIHSDMLIKSCLSSDFIMLRLEALSILVQKHNKTALGQVEALMNMVHKQYHPIFVDFFALSGTKYAISMMKQMMSDKDLNLNLATIMAAKNYSLEELIPNLRNSLTHTSPCIQEAAASALGFFHDAFSISKLEALTLSPHTETKLAALYALYILGQTECKKKIYSLARDGNLYATRLAAGISESETTLHEIYYSDDNNLRLNSALSLLDQKDPLCMPVIKDLITLDTNVNYLEVSYSPGRAFSALKIKPLAGLEHKQMTLGVQQQTMTIQNQLLAKSIELPRQKFMTIVDEIFLAKRNDLVPTAIALLENIDDAESREYLKVKAAMPGAPFIRASCHLSLWKSTKEEVHKEAIKTWIKDFGKHQLINIAQKTTANQEKKGSVTGYELSLEEKSHLLIQAFLNISLAHEKSGLDCIIDAMIYGHEKNRTPLAGVLLKTIQ